MNTVGSRVADAIWRTYIERGRPEDALPPMRELQNEFGVSIHAVSAALRDLVVRGSIRKDSAGRGRYVILPTTKNGDGLIGLVSTVGAHFDLVFRVLHGMQSLAQPHGLRVVMGRSDGVYEREREEIYRLRALGCVGVVVIPVVRTPAQLAADYLARELRDYPIALVDMAYPEQGRPAVVFDNVGAALALTRHFLARGMRRIAFVDIAADGSALMTRSLLERWRGVCQAMEEVGAQAERWTVPLRFDRGPADAEVRRAALALLERWAAKPSSERPQVLIAPEDKTACMLTVGACARGIDVPNDLAFAGFDNLSLAEMCEPRFPTTCPDFALAGRRATEMVLNHAATSPQLTPWHTLQVPLRVEHVSHEEEALPMLPVAISF